MILPRRRIPFLLLAATALLSCDAQPTTICIGGPPRCDGDPTPTSVTITPSAGTLIFLGQTLQLNATVFDQLQRPIEEITVSWSSSEKGIATVSADGLVTAAGNGNVVISANGQGATGSVSLLVEQAPSSIVITPDPVTLPGPGSGAVLSTSAMDAGGAEIAIVDLSWSSANTNIATVIDDGVVTGVAEGTTTLTVQVTNGGSSADGQVDVTVSAPTPGTVSGTVFDAATSLVVSGASVTLDGTGGPVNTTTDGSGAYSFSGVTGGTYSVTVSGAGFFTATAADLEVATGIGEVVRADFALTPATSTRRFGSLSGKVTFGGAPLSNATVSISGGAQTNGVFQSTTTDANGNYALVGVNMDDPDGVPIPQFTVLSTLGFSAASVDLALVQNQTLPNVDLELEPSSGVSLYFEDDFESPVLGWEMTGFWNRATLAGLSNSAFPTFVNLAPGDVSGGDLPSPIQGQWAYWYGQPETGNFIGIQVAGDPPGSGGTSESANDGELKSPSFQIPAGISTATLRFSTWFEIESVNPNASGFDVMNVGVLPAGSSNVTVLARLNPFVDPTLTPRDAIPFTSGGFNKPPVWRTDFIDLSDFVGQTVQIVFDFATVDGLYNGFRGWVVDDVSVSSLNFGAPTLAPPPPAQVGPAPARTR